MKKKTMAMTGAAIAGAAAAFVISGVAAIDYACKRKSIITHKHNPAENHSLDMEDYLWIKEQKFQDMEITSFDGLKLKGKYLPADKKTNKVLIAIHGYHATNFQDFSYYLRFYHQLGFNILMPNNRAHGDSEGTYIGFGWLDRLDVLEWLHVIQRYFDYEPIQIVLNGISMGSATVLMASGEQLPSDVKCIIADCSYTSVYDQFKQQLKKSHIPPALLLPSATLLSKMKVGYNFKEASALKQVEKSHTPTLFIHGDQDQLVPTYMVYELYNACTADKDLLVVEGARHAESYLVNKELCEKTMKEFISKYVK